MSGSTSQGVNELDASREVLNSSVLEVIKGINKKAKILAGSLDLQELICELKKTINDSSEFIEILIELSKILIKSNCYNHSLIVFEMILSVDPINTSILPLYRRALVKSKYGLKANRIKANTIFEKHLSNAVKIDPYNIDLLHSYALIFAGLENFSKALEILGSALKISQLKIDIALDYVKILLKEKSLDEIIVIVDHLRICQQIGNSIYFSKDEELNLILLSIFCKNESDINQISIFSLIVNDVLNNLVKSKKYEDASFVLVRYFQINLDGFNILSSYINNLQKMRAFNSLHQLVQKTSLNTPEKISLVCFTIKFLPRKSLYYQAALLKIENILRIYLYDLIEDYDLKFEINEFLRERSNILINRIREFCKQKDEDKIIEIWRFLYFVNPFNIQIANELTSIFLRNHNYQEAIKIYENLLELIPDEVTILTKYANTLSQQGRYNESFQAYERAFHLNPTNLIMLNSYANTLAKCDHFEEAFSLFDHALNINQNDVITLNNYAYVLAKQGNLKKSFKLFEHSLKINETNIVTLNIYANALIIHGKYEQAFNIFDRALYLDVNDTRTLNNYAKALVQIGSWQRLIEIRPTHSYARLQYAQQLEGRSNFKEALIQLLAIDLTTQKTYHANIIRLNLGRLYYRLGQIDLGKQFFEEAIANSDEQDKTILYAARSLLATNPNSQEAINLFLKIPEDSPRYAEAMKAIALNADEETSYELFGADEDQIDDIEMLYRAMYHKIGNEIAVLRSISYRLLKRMEGEHPLVKEIVNDFEKLQQGIASQRASEKAAIAGIAHSNYKQLIEIVSKTAHDISDEVNNQLAVIESKTRRAMRKLTPENPQYQQFEKLILQLKITQKAINDLKSINEGKTIRRNRFLVHRLFEKWEPENWTSQPRIDGVRIRLDIRNPDSEFNGDEEKIKSILNELVENSLKHNQGNSNLSIRMYSSDLLNPSDISSPTIPGDRKFLYIEFTDNGQGIPSDKKEWIFQPLKTTSPEDKGSGLGLFIARKTIKKMGGQIQEAGKVGKGVRFQIYLPYISANAL
jgi:signal transduction histidine kinase